MRVGKYNYAPKPGSAKADKLLKRHAKLWQIGNDVGVWALIAGLVLFVVLLGADMLLTPFPVAIFWSLAPFVLVFAVCLTLIIFSDWRVSRALKQGKIFHVPAALDRLWRNVTDKFGEQAESLTEQDKHKVLHWLISQPKAEPFLPWIYRGAPPEIFAVNVQTLAEMRTLQLLHKRGQIRSDERK